jgi:tetraacyldisaccharide 4'-kinase
MSAADWARAYVAGEAVAGRAVADVVLRPAEWLYRSAVVARAAAYRRGLLHPEAPALPVLSVGNLLVGGAGKTPVAAYLAARLRALGARPAIVHGGYAADEPRLHTFWHPDIPVIVGRDRRRAVRDAVAVGADAAVLDDGFQHLALERTVDLVLVPVERWSPTPRLLPRGPWREAPAALRRADIVALSHRGAPPARVAEVRASVAVFGPAPVAEFVVEAVGWRRLGDGDHDGAPAGPALGVCAIADPEGFRRSAATAGARLTDLVTYEDHHDYDATDLARLRRIAGDRPILTTEKDAVKLGALARDTQVWALRERVRLVAGETVIAAALERLIR